MVKAFQGAEPAHAKVLWSKEAWYFKGTARKRVVDMQEAREEGTEVEAEKKGGPGHIGP